jgi:class 3 adenylate cyclase/tetratricopeptide (TPR) repeat protein
MPTCPSCGQENPEGFRLCGMCGAPLVGASAVPRETRKTVTVVFADVTGSTALGERLDPESLRQVMGRYFEAMRLVLERHGGTVEKFIGDAVVAVFGIPVLHEDDALRAVRAAAEMGEALDALNEELEPEFGIRIAGRIGVNTGEVMAGDAATGQSYATGDAVNVAARLEQASEPGQILIGEPTFRLVRDAVRAERVEPLALKGKEEPVDAFLLLEVVPGAVGYARRLDSPLVGRAGELRLLQEAFERTVREPACHLFTILGTAGVGKSRLVAEFLLGVEGAGVAQGRCLPYGDGITYWPVIEALHEALGLTQGEPPERARQALDGALADEDHAEVVGQRVAELLGLAHGSSSGEELFWAVRKLLESLARRRPLVLVLDDIQWGEQTFLDLVEHVADWSRGVPILLLCIARPELHDVRPAWGGGKLNATSVLLEPLNDDESGRLAENLLGTGHLETDVRRRVAAAAEGNPLFVEELLAVLIEDGLLRRENGGWTAAAGLEALPVPPGIRALLAARLDRLPDVERLLIERASIEGQVFHRGAVAALAGGSSADVSRGLMTLERRDLIRSDRPTFTGEEAFRFRHLLIRDAAYEALPKEERARLHELFADWLEERTGARAAEYAEIIGYHLEQAVRYRAELALRRPGAGDLAARAGGWLGTAGHRVLARGDASAAAVLLRRALELLPETEPERAELMGALVTSYDAIGELGRELETAEAAIEAGRHFGNRRVEWRARATRAWLRWNMDPSQSVEQTRRDADTAVRTLEELGDDAGLARAWRLIADVDNALGEGAQWAAGLERAFEHAVASGDRHEQWMSLWILGGAMYFGPTPAAQAISRLAELRERHGHDPLLEAAVCRPLGAFVAMQGQIEEGRSLIRRARAVMTEFGHFWALVGVPFMSAAVELLAGNPEAAVDELRPSLDFLQGIGERARLSSLAADLAKALCEARRWEEADEIARICAETADPEDVQPQMGWRIARVRILAERGRLDEADEVGRRLLEFAERTDFLLERASAFLALAEAARARGNKLEAGKLMQRAVGEYEQKGNRVAKQRAKTLLAELGE